MTSVELGTAVPPPLPEVEDGQDVPRSPHKIDREALRMLFLLNKTQPWIEPLQERLFELMDLCDNIREQKLVCDLLGRFVYIGTEKLLDNLTLMADQIVRQWQLRPEATIIVSTNKSRFSDSSEAILWHLKPKFAPYDGWSTINFYSAMGQAADAAYDGYSIVLVEDFVGTGESIRKAAEWIDKRIKDRGINCSLKVCSIAAMKHSKSEIEKITVDIFVCNWLEKGISDYYKDSDLAQAIADMQKIELKLCDLSEGGKLKDLHFGYKKSEALYHMAAGNTPNNVFPIFWWEWLKHKQQRRPILERI